MHDDFIGHNFKVPKMDLRLGGLARGWQIAGIGNVHWLFQADDGSLLTIQTKPYCIPEVNQRLLSPQSFFKENIGIKGWMVLSERNRNDSQE
jgi:hypothetical protein